MPGRDQTASFLFSGRESDSCCQFRAHATIRSIDRTLIGSDIGAPMALSAAWPPYRTRSRTQTLPEHWNPCKIELSVSSIATAPCESADFSPLTSVIST